MKTKYIALLLLLGLCSCTQMRYNIAKRHLDKIGLEVCDTVTIHDTTVVTESRTDTVLRISEITHDTVIIREGQSEVKYFYNTHDSTIYIEGKCHDTIIIEERDGQDKFIVTEVEKSNWHTWLFIGMIAGFLLFMIMQRLKK